MLHRINTGASELWMWTKLLKINCKELYYHQSIGQLAKEEICLSGQHSNM